MYIRKVSNPYIEISPRIDGFNFLDISDTTQFLNELIDLFNAPVSLRLAFVRKEDSTDIFVELHVKFTDVYEVYLLGKVDKDNMFIGETVKIYI